MFIRQSPNAIKPLFSEEDRNYRSTEPYDSILRDGFFPADILRSAFPGSLQAECLLPENSGINGALYQIETSALDAYRETDGRLVLRPEMESIRSTLQTVSCNKHRWLDVYSPRINLFLTSFGLFFNEDFKFDAPNERWRHYEEQTGAVVEKRLGDWVNDFVGYLRKQLCSKKLRRAEKNWAGDYCRRMKALKKHIDGCFEVCSRLLVVRLDLYQERFTPADVDHFHRYGSQVYDTELITLLERVGRFQNNRRHNKLFKHLVSSVVKIEYGPDRGYHAHLLLFFNGHKVENDSYYSVAIGDYWVDQITDGKGSYWACNRSENKQRYQWLGIGMIEKSEEKKRRSLLRVASYLAKSDLHLTTKACVGQKLLRIGRLPKRAPGAKRGPKARR